MDFFADSQHVACSCGAQQPGSVAVIAASRLIGLSGLGSTRWSVVTRYPFLSTVMDTDEIAVRWTQFPRRGTSAGTLPLSDAQADGWADGEVSAMTSVVHDDVEALWRQFAVDVRAFILARVASPEDAEDIAQLVFLRMIERVDSIRDAERLTGWLYTTTRNAITDYYRSAARRRELPVDAVPDHPVAEDVDGQAEQELARCLLPMVERLPAEQAEAIRMVDLAGMSQAAAAAALRLSHSGMKSRVQRGRARLRDMLLACCHVEQDVRGRAQGCQPRTGTDGQRCGG